MVQPIQVNQIKLATSFQTIRRYISLNRKDWVHLNSGDEGSGKFNLTSLCIESMLDKDRLKAFFSEIKRHVHYTIADYGYAVRNSEPYEIQVLDEPVELLARTPTAETNIMLLRTLFTCREKQVISIINVQRLFTIDWVVRDRARSLAHAYFSTNTKTLKDSYFYKYFSKPRMKKIWYEDKTHVVHLPFPNYYDRVTDFFGDRYPQYWKWYLNYKNSMTYLRKEEDSKADLQTFRQYLNTKDSGEVVTNYQDYFYAKGNHKKELILKWSRRFEQPPKVVIKWLKEIYG